MARQLMYLSLVCLSFAPHFRKKSRIQKVTYLTYFPSEPLKNDRMD